MMSQLSNALQRTSTESRSKDTSFWRSKIPLLVSFLPAYHMISQTYKRREWRRQNHKLLTLLNLMIISIFNQWLLIILNLITHISIDVNNAFVKFENHLLDHLLTLDVKNDDMLLLIRCNENRIVLIESHVVPLGIAKAINSAISIVGLLAIARIVLSFSPKRIARIPDFQQTEPTIASWSAIII